MSQGARLLPRKKPRIIVAMTPTTVKTAMSLVGILAGAAIFVPQLLPYQAALSALSAGLLAWAHGKRPGDEKAPPPTPRSGEL